MEPAPFPLNAPRRRCPHDDVRRVHDRIIGTGSEDPGPPVGDRDRVEPYAALDPGGTFLVSEFPSRTTRRTAGPFPAG